MALACNIDQRGRRYRYRIGFVLMALGVGVGLLALLFLSGKSPWLASGLLLAGGLFSLFEANRGWCAARALGFKTRI